MRVRRSPGQVREVSEAMGWLRARRNRKVLAAAQLDDGEAVDVISVAEWGPFKSYGAGDTQVAARTRCGVVLTDRRLMLVETSMSAKRRRVIGEYPRQSLARSEVRTRAYLWFDLLDTRYEGAYPLRLHFTLPNRAQARQIADALPIRT